jgi:hypothetical protein
MNHFEAGLWKAQCDRCGFWLKSDKLRLEWTGLRVCSACLDHRHPQEFVRGKADKQVTAWSRPATEGTDVSSDGTMITPDDL